MPNFGYHLARFKGLVAREFYRTLLPAIVRLKLTPASSIPIDVFSYSGESSLPEQILCIRSFIKYAGRPNRFVIVSDGSHSAEGVDLLTRCDASVRVVSIATRLPKGLPETIYPYLTNHPTGKQLSVVMSLPEAVPALYVDSDVLFFPGALNLAALVSESRKTSLYLADCQMSGDERLLRNSTERALPVNTGLLFLTKRMDWQLGISRLLDLNGAEPNFFTNQTITHLTMHANGALPLDSCKYVLSLRDQFIYRDLYAGKEIVARHYVNPVRHKMWCSIW